MKITEEQQYQSMTARPVFGLVASLSVPTVVSMLITSLYSMVDTYFVSGLGTSATAAVGVVYSLQSLMQAIGFGLGMGSQSLVSRLLGQKKCDEASCYASSAAAAAVAFGLFMLTVGLTLTQPLVTLFGASATMVPFACDYGWLILLAAPVMCPSFVLSNVLRAEGKAVLSMVGLTAGGLLNIILDPLFIYVLDFGVSGAAAATAVSQLVSFCILASYFLSRKSIVSISLCRVSRSPKIYGHLIVTGSPTITRQGMGSVATALLNIIAKPFGDSVVAAVSIAMKIYMFMRNIVVGIGQGFMPVACYNYGAKKYDRVKGAYFSALVFGSAFCLVATAVLLILPREIMLWFGKHDPVETECGVKMLRFFCLSLPVMGFSTFTNQLLQALGQTKSAIFLASLRQGICFIPLILILPTVFGLDGVLSAQALSDVLTAVISLPFLLCFFSKLYKKA